MFNLSNIFKNNHLKFKKIFKYKQKINIIANSSTEFVAYAIKDFFSSMKIECTIQIDNSKPYYKIDEIYFLMSPVWLNRFPKYYFVFNLEQFTAKRWMNKRYFKILKKAICVFDYSKDNILFFKKKVRKQGLFYFPIPLIWNESNNKRQIPLLFYGMIENSRRKEMINEIQKETKISVVSNKFGEEINKTLSLTKIVINIHYYNESLLETTRICQALSNGCLVISEKSIFSYPAIFNNLVDFFNIGNISEAINLANHYLNNKDDYNKKILNNKNIINKFKVDSYKTFSNLIRGILYE